jgi:hypothetical protein
MGGTFLWQNTACAVLVFAVHIFREVLQILLQSGAFSQGTCIQEAFGMRFTLPRDIYYGPGALDELKRLSGKKAAVVVGGGSMKRFGFLDRVLQNLKEAGLAVRLIEGVEPDPSVETVLSGAKTMQEFEPDWIVAMGGGSPIDAAKAMWVFYEYPETKFEDLIEPFSFPALAAESTFFWRFHPLPVQQPR